VKKWDKSYIKELNKIFYKKSGKRDFLIKEVKNRMNSKELEETKKKILILASKDPFPLTASKVSEALNLNYFTTQGLLLELAVEGYLILRKERNTRYYVLNREKFLPKNVIKLEER